MVDFEDERMQKYFRIIEQIENIDLDLMIANKKIELEQAKNMNSLFVVCYISFFVFGIPKYLFDNIFQSPYFFLIYLFITLTGIAIGMIIYNRLVKQPLIEYEVLSYLKIINYSKI